MLHVFEGSGYLRNERNVYVTPSCITLCEECTFIMYTRTSQNLDAMRELS